MKKKVTLLLACLITLIAKTACAQILIERQVLGSTGNLTNGGSINVSSSVGESVVSTFTYPTMIATQGFEQPDTMITINLSVNKNAQVQIKVYPNPTKDKVIMELNSEYKLGEIKAIIMNGAGQEIIHELITNTDKSFKREISVSGLPNGNYFLKLNFLNSNILKVVKLQKL